MIEFFVGKRIAKALRDAWLHDGMDGKLGAAVVITAVGGSVGQVVVNLVQAVA